MAADIGREQTPSLRSPRRFSVSDVSSLCSLLGRSHRGLVRVIDGGGVLAFLSKAGNTSAVGIMKSAVTAVISACKFRLEV